MSKNEKQNIFNIISLNIASIISQFFWPKDLINLAKSCKRLKKLFYENPKAWIAIKFNVYEKYIKQKGINEEVEFNSEQNFLQFFKNLYERIYFNSSNLVGFKFLPNKQNKELNFSSNNFTFAKNSSENMLKKKNSKSFFKNSSIIYIGSVTWFRINFKFEIDRGIYLVYIRMLFEKGFELNETCFTIFNENEKLGFEKSQLLYKIFRKTDREKINSNNNFKGNFHHFFLGKIDLTIFSDSVKKLNFKIQEGTNFWKGGCWIDSLILTPK